METSRRKHNKQEQTNLQTAQKNQIDQLQEEEAHRFMKKCPMPLAIKRMQIRFHLSQVRIAFIRNTMSPEKNVGDSSHDPWKRKSVQPIWKPVWTFLWDFKTDLLHSSACTAHVCMSITDEHFIYCIVFLSLQLYSQLAVVLVVFLLM